MSKELERSGRFPERFASYIFASVVCLRRGCCLCCLGLTDFNPSQALTLEKLAANNIIHRDMKPQNVVWASDGTPKIIDFGLALIPDGPLTENCGTEAYMAPEVVNREDYGSEVDEWSWEVAHFEMVTGVVSIVHL